MNKKTLPYILATLLIGGIAIWTIVGRTVNAPTPTSSESVVQSPQISVVPTSGPSETISVTQSISYGGLAADVSSTLAAVEGQSALDLLTSTQTVELKQYDFGSLVESVNGIKNGTDKKYWLYYVNDKESSVGASQYLVQDNDQIKWVFKEYSE